MDIGGPEILIVLLVVVLLFGGSKLPKLARSLGSAKGEFEKGVREGESQERRRSRRGQAGRDQGGRSPPEPVIDTTATVTEDKPTN